MSTSIRAAFVVLLLAACTADAPPSADARSGVGDATSKEPSVSLPLVAVLGDSTALSTLTVATLSPQYQFLATPHPTVTGAQRYALGSNSPIDWKDIPTQNWEPRDDPEIGVTDAIGVEMGMAYVMNEGRIIKWCASGSNLQHYTTGAIWDDRQWLVEREAEYGQPIDAVVMLHGSNDAGVLSRANAYNANLHTLADGLESLLGHKSYWIVVRLHRDHAQEYAATVRHAQEAFVSDRGAPLARLVLMDDLSMAPDNIHFLSNTYAVLGDRIGEVVREAFQVPTTYKLIRERQIATVKALTPTLLSTLGRFTLVPDHDFPDFESWCDQAVDPFRVFEIRTGLDYEGEGEVPGMDASHATHSQELLVAYPKLQTMHGDRVEYLMDEDLTDITQALGLRGYANYEALGSGLHKCERAGSFVEERPSCRVLHIRFALDYDRSI